jgi:large subunit ribosomal protein L20
MPRAKTRVPSRARRKKIIKAAKGYYGRRKSNLTQAKEAVDRAGVNAYIHRKDRKGDFRRLWIVRINAAARSFEMSYSQLMGGLKKAGIELNRKVLADIALSDAKAFEQLVSTAKAA